MADRASGQPSACGYRPALRKGISHYIVLRPIGIPWQPLTVTRKGQLTLRKELLQHLGIQPGQRVDVEVLPGGRLELHAERATAEMSGFIGLLAGRTSKTASLEELTEAAAAGWAAQ